MTADSTAIFAAPPTPRHATSCAGKHRKKLGWIENPPTNEPPPECVAELGPLPGAKPAPEVSALLPSDPKVHTGAATAAEAEEDDEFLRTRRRNWARLYVFRPARLSNTIDHDTTYTSLLATQHNCRRSGSHSRL